jgi:pimeloyl-ACP methyl ester carboxylesterase
VNLRVPGACLYYEIQGTGPLLLLICGGVYDAAAYAGLVQQLEDRYTVVTYDRRGNSRSPLDEAPEEQSIAVHGDDAHRLLSAVAVAANEPAHVFGNSSGAIIGLELAARHPEQVRTLVAHEPPIFELLSDRDYWRAVIEDVRNAFIKDGPGRAGEVLGAGFASMGGEPAEVGAEAEPNGHADGAERIPGGADPPQGEPDPETMAMLARLERNFEFFIGCEVPPFARYAPDIAALLASSVRVVAAVGDASPARNPEYRGALAVADRLGTRPVLFPGDHGGFGNRPEEFASRLHEVLSSS